MVATDGNRKWAIPAILIGLMSVFLGLVSMANVVSSAAATTANEASDQAAKVASDLSIHSARQNGSFESIESRLSQLQAGQVRQDKVLDELLRYSYAHDSNSPP